MATTTPNFGWSVPTSTDLVKDGATAIETLGDSIDSSLVDLKGGTTGQYLKKNSNTDMDFVWGGGGKMLQVVFASYSTETSSSTTTYADTGLSATITPSSTSSKVLVFVNTNGATTDTVTNQGIKLKLVRTSTDLAVITDLSNKMAGAATAVQGESIGFNWLDSPSSTSALTYKTQYARLAGSGTVTLQNQMNSNGSTSTITLIEVGV
jgi:hypothetical protein